MFDFSSQFFQITEDHGKGGTSGEDVNAGRKGGKLEDAGREQKGNDLVLWALKDAEDQGLNHPDIGRAQQTGPRQIPSAVGNVQSALKKVKRVRWRKR